MVRSESMQEFATLLNTHHMDTSFTDWIVHSQPFQDCVKLTHNQDEMSRWFNDFVECDDLEIARVCQSILRKLLLNLDDAIFSGKKSISFEKTLFDYYCSSDFDEFIKIDLPEKLRNNRTAAVCIVDSMHILFEDWVYDATAEIAKSRKDTAELQVCIGDKGVVKMMQKMVGAGIPKALKKFGAGNNEDDPANILLNCVRWYHKDAMDDTGYVEKWYPMDLRFENKGKLSLIHPKFLDCASELIIYAVNFFTKTRMIQHRRNTVSFGLQQVKQHEALFESFKRAALTVDGIDDITLDDITLRKIHTYLAKYAYNAYTGFRWSDEFRGEKDSSDDKSNLAFRQLIQTTGSGDGKKSKSNEKKAAKNKRSLADIHSSIGRRSRQLQKKAHHQIPINSNLPLLP